MNGETFRDRLRRLRRDGDATPAPHADEPHALERSAPAPRTDELRAWQRSAPTPLHGEVATSGERLGRADAAPLSPQRPDAPVRERLARRADRAGRASRTRGARSSDGQEAVEPADPCGALASAATSGELTEPEVERAEIPYARTLGLPERLESQCSAGSTVHARRTTFACGYCHGDVRLDDVATADARAFEILTGDRALGALDPLRAIYLDTETTGLNGGAGTYVFLVGLGYFVGDRFQIWQGFLRDPGGERALLDETAQRIRSVPGVVSFFGKAFDRHRLEDKMRMHKIAPPFAGRAHLDLYHPLRRLYRSAFEDSRLRTFESRLCGLDRKGDLPGAFAPAAWFDFLADRPHRLEAVFRHNQDDVLSLVSLAAHLGCVLRGTRGDGSPLDEHAARRAEAVGRSLAAQGEPSRALEWIERAIAALDDPRSRHGRALRLFRITLLRKTGGALAALTESRVLATEPEDELSAIAWYELARLCERPLGDLDRAAEGVARARALLEHHSTGQHHARWSRACRTLELRLRRLVERRMS